MVAVIVPFVGFHVDLIDRRRHTPSFVNVYQDREWWPFEWQATQGGEISAGNGAESIYQYGDYSGDGAGGGQR